MTAFEEYLDAFGFHFNRKLYLFAVSGMTDRNGNRLVPMEKDKVNELLKANGITLRRDKGYDAAWVMMMAKADFWGSSIEDEKHLAMFVRDFLDDPDGSATKAFDHFVIDCKAKDEPVDWYDML